MNLCAQCIKTKELNICTDALIIGTVTANTYYNIWFRCLANGFIVKYEATSDAYGLLILDSSAGLILATNLGYEMYINTTSSVETGEDFVIGTTTVNCLVLTFVNAGFVSTSQTIELQ